MTLLSAIFLEYVLIVTENAWVYSMYQRPSLSVLKILAICRETAHLFALQIILNKKHH